MNKQSFTRQTLIKADLDQTWQFFSNPRNLPLITPPDMRFRILNEDVPSQISEGMIIRYRVNPIWGIPVIWETEISAVEPGHFFIDVQKRGPYAQWEHTHVFELHRDGVLMTDHVLYRLPAGMAGDRLMGSVVKRRLRQIFDYRERQISSIFNASTYASTH